MKPIFTGGQVMLTAERTPFMSANLSNVVSTNADTDSPITQNRSGAETARQAWQELIDEKLIEWGRNTRQFDDEGLEPPSRKTVRLAIQAAEQFRDAGYPPPNCVVPDPNGGIVFELRQNGSAEVVHVWDDGTVEYQQFRGARLVARRTL